MQHLSSPHWATRTSFMNTSNLEKFLQICLEFYIISLIKSMLSSFVIFFFWKICDFFLMNFWVFDKLKKNLTVFTVIRFFIHFNTNFWSLQSFFITKKYNHKRFKETAQKISCETFDSNFLFSYCHLISAKKDEAFINMNKCSRRDLSVVKTLLFHSICFS